MKWVVELSPAAVTWRSGKMATLRLSGGCHLTERSWMEEVATHLTADRPLPDDGLFVDQSEMIYSMDSRSFYHEFGAHVPLSVQAARAPARGYSLTELPTRLRARLADGFPPFCNILVLFLFLHLSQK
ncbi:unnamed protein product [Spirodela intermedia]|uniref:Uncharacterized protein n=1 Tax=Spirodela intermedia TaxID=51605 RepID=A0A7I8JXI7_SPIIN|nr:unnamed protein product [Spirodela intermedia]